VDRLAVLALACVLYAMDLTVLRLAVPSLSADLQPSGAELLWITDIYGFMVAGFLVTMGTLLARFAPARRRGDRRRRQSGAAAGEGLAAAADSAGITLHGVGTGRAPCCRPGVGIGPPVLPA
jgi:MFS transporter, DHA2 family, multidrug resistance protein